MRILTDHVVEGDSARQLKIEVLDQPSQDGANYWYEISDIRGCLAKILFQNGPIKEFGVSGVTQEALAAIIIDRLRSFQNGPFNCESNERALECFTHGLHHLQTRTRERIARGVEGTNTK